MEAEGSNFRGSRASLHRAVCEACLKYMGSKRTMLMNGLGDLLAEHAPNATRFVDLFAGSGAVAIHVATKYAIPVAAFDLQQYSAVLAGAVLKRQSELKWRQLWSAWHARATADRSRFDAPEVSKVTIRMVEEARDWSVRRRSLRSRKRTEDIITRPPRPFGWTPTVPHFQDLNRPGP